MTLNVSTRFENAILQNFTIHRRPRHINFVMNQSWPLCSEISSLPLKLRCQYASLNEECASSNYLINYYKLIYCTMDPSVNWNLSLSILVLFLITGLIFMSLYTTAEKFFCPQLRVLSKLLHMSENLTGVTLLAFGNGAPDVITNYVNFQRIGSISCADVYGSAVVVVCLVTGTIMVFFPFKIDSFQFYRDTLVFLLSIVFLDYISSGNKKITLTESIMFSSIYLIYIVIIVLDEWVITTGDAQINKIIENKHQNQLKNEVPSFTSLSSGQPISIDSKFSIMTTDTDIKTNVEEFNLEDDMKYFYYDPEHFNNQYLIGQFIETINPMNNIEIDEDAGPIEKIFLVFLMPVKTVLILIIPQINIHLPMHGWSKLLNCIQIVTLPFIAIYTCNRGTITIMGSPLRTWTIPFTAPLAVLVFMTSRTDLPPFYHHYLTLPCAISSAFVVYTCCEELISILAVIGVTTYMSSAFLSSTLVSLGNCLCDLVSNTSMARHGFQKMAFAACFGGPLFSSMLVIGSLFLYHTITSAKHIYEIKEGAMGETCRIFLIVAVTCLILGASTTNYVLRRSLGIFMIFLYVVYIAVVTLNEYEIVHSYGSDHSLDMNAIPDFDIF